MQKLSLEKLREIYPSGTPIVLDEMYGESRMLAGLRGTVDFIDDASQIHVKWENGSSLAIVPEVDRFHKA